MNAKSGGHLRMIVVFFISVIEVLNNDFILWSSFIEKCTALEIIEMMMLK